MKRQSKCIHTIEGLSILTVELFFTHREEHLRYVYLLRRYLEIKYPTIAEAKESFSQLMNDVEEMRQLNADIMFFFRSYSSLLQTSPLFTQMLDLDNNSVSTKPINPNADSVFDGTVYEDPNNIFANLDVNQHMDNMVHNLPVGTTNSGMAENHFTTNAYTGSIDNDGTGVAQGPVGSVGAPAGSLPFGVSPASNTAAANAASSSANSYRECILNSAN